MKECLSKDLSWVCAEPESPSEAGSPAPLHPEKSVFTAQ